MKIKWTLTLYRNVFNEMMVIVVVVMALVVVVVMSIMMTTTMLVVMIVVVVLVKLATDVGSLEHTNLFLNLRGGFFYTDAI